MEAKDSIRALFGSDGTKNAVHGSDSRIIILSKICEPLFQILAGAAQRELDFFFSQKSKIKVQRGVDCELS